MTDQDPPIGSDDLVPPDPEIEMPPVADTDEELPGQPADIAPVGSDRPDHVPEKFWDPDAGTVRTEALLKSYVELERKLGTMISPPSGDDDIDGRNRLRRWLGVPESADDYAIQPMSEALAPDPEVNARLHGAGFTQEQAQLVYDLAAERLGPLIDDALADVEAAREAERLSAHFGGEEVWRGTARQIQAWGGANLPSDVFEVLACSADGVIAMHQMMQAREPSILHHGGAGDPRVDQMQLSKMMQDPKYWRDRDPKYIAKITEGFRRLYND